MTLMYKRDGSSAPTVLFYIPVVIGTYYLIKETWPTASNTVTLP